ncbi:MAG: hypothetical protein FWD58_04935 [Firmicutes bacterium]|nr:hypothetical protein [Bacillota bacterium]
MAFSSAQRRRVAGDGDPYGIVCVHPESRTPNPESRVINGGGSPGTATPTGNR